MKNSKLKNLMKTLVYLTLLISFIIIPFYGLSAQSPQDSEGSFRAVVLEILEEKEILIEGGGKTIQQNVKLRGIESEWRGQEVIFQGISGMVVTKSAFYKKGDKVVVTYFKNQEGENIFYISDFVRVGNLYLLMAIFVLVIIVVNRWKGVAALLSLVLSFFIIMKMILPMISDGYSPLLIAILGSFFILFFVIYITEGFNKKSHYAILSIVICLIITAVLSYLFTYLTRLSGMAQEEVLFLVAAGKNINFQGLLLAGIVIGTLGVLDDIVVSQVETISQIKKATPKINKKALLKMANEIGSSHLGAVTNTLFLAYAGASLPLLMLFSLGDNGSSGVFNQVINNEMIATEIVRTLAGVIGLTLVVPITNLLMVYFYSPETENIIASKEKFNRCKMSK
jgi:uncharacterized membrane protein